MNSYNIAIVRATNAIPFDGVVRPVKDVPFIKKETNTEFAREFRSLLRRKGKLAPIDFSDPVQTKATEDRNNEILEEYMPYTSMYNSMVLWSLNGLVPDDDFNTFSNKTCVIVDGLSEQLEQSQVVSLCSTDTAIKGEVKLSNNAIILIAKERYDQLSNEQKDQLKKLNLKVSVFEGDLKQAINEILVESGRYTAENLQLAREGGGYVESATSNEVAKTIDSVAKEYDIPQILHNNIFRGETGGAEKLEDVKGEYEQCNQVAAVYKQAFFDYLFSRMDIDEITKAYSKMAPDTSRYMEDLCDEIGRIGIDKYKEIVDSFNTSLEDLQKSGKLPTPQIIVEAVREGKSIDLVSMINEVQILKSGIEATEQTTTMTQILNQEKTLGNIDRMYATPNID